MSDEIAAERVHWDLPTSTGEHGLDILPSAVGTRVSLEVDGHGIGQLPKPSVRSPWSETSISVGGTVFVVALTWHYPVMHTDVFHAGASLRDGRNLEQARAAAPAPVRGYELWFRTGFSLTRGPLAPKWATALAVGGLAVVGLVVVAPIPEKLGGTIMLAGAYAIIAAWVWYWLAFTVAVHRYLLRHAELGDAVRAAVLVGSFSGFPVVTIASAAAVVLLAHALT